MITVADIYRAIDGVAPFNTQLEFDNAGLLVGDPDNEVKKVAVALDATVNTITKAAQNGCNLLVTHHPVIFSPLKRLTPADAAYTAALMGVSVISAHTNLDSAKGGVNGCLAKQIGLAEVSPLDDFARIGRLSAASAQALATHVKASIGCGCVKYVPTEKAIKRVAVCGGSGGDFIMSAYNAGADALVTGECKHHDRLLAAGLGIALLECGHFATEQAVKAVLKTIIERTGAHTVVLNECDPAQYI